MNAEACCASTVHSRVLGEARMQGSYLINIVLCSVLLHVDKVGAEEGPALSQEAPLHNMHRCACHVCCEHFIQLHTYKQPFAQWQCSTSVFSDAQQLCAHSDYSIKRSMWAMQLVPTGFGILSRNLLHGHITTVTETASSKLMQQSDARLYELMEHADTQSVCDWCHRPTAETCLGAPGTSECPSFAV